MRPQSAGARYKPRAYFRRGALIATMSATRWSRTRCHLTCTDEPTFRSHHEALLPPTRKRVLSVVWYVEARPLRTPVNVRAPPSMAVAGPPPLGVPWYAAVAAAARGAAG